MIYNGNLSERIFIQIINIKQENLRKCENEGDWTDIFY